MPSYLPWPVVAIYTPYSCKLQLRLDADLFEITQDHLHGIDQVVAVARRCDELGFQTLEKAGLRQHRRSELLA
jgi:hypothetical protein